MDESVFPVVFGIDLDAEASWLGKAAENADRPVLLSIGRYAVEEGLEPLLALLKKRGIGATFFIPGIIAERYPDSVRAIRAGGHEVGSHGHMHRSPPLLTAEEERDELFRGIDAVTAASGQRPVSWQSPAWEFTARTIPLLLEAGVTVSANFQDRDRPYRHTRDGRPLPLVECPVHWHLADAPYFTHGGQPGRVIQTHSAVLEIWRDEFAGLYERPGAYFHLTLHVQLIGHPSRLAMLERLVEFIEPHPRARFMTCAEVAAQVP
jgi:peptidoglycan/xylan/chitin deacetylase (PgdA/CDA1 family)